MSDPEKKSNTMRLQGGFCVILNFASGSHSSEVLLETIKKFFEESGKQFDIHTLKGSDDVFAVCSSLVKNAKKQDRAVVVAGGDGTVNTVASLCCQFHVPLGVLPMGTFNYFARDLAIPLEVEKALGVILEGNLKKVAVGKVSDHIFLNNASIGFYKKLIEQREFHKSRFGRFRVVALLSAIGSLFRYQKNFSVTLVYDGIKQIRRTMMVFVGNNTLQLDNLSLSVAECTQQNKLGVILLQEMKFFQTITFLVRIVCGKLDTEKALKQFCVESFEVNMKRKNINVVIDGEIIACKLPLVFQIEKEALEVFCPRSIAV